MIKNINICETPCDYGMAYAMPLPWHYSVVVEGIKRAIERCDNPGGVVPVTLVHQYFMEVAPNQNAIPCLENVKEFMHAVATIFTDGQYPFIFYCPPHDRFYAGPFVWSKFHPSTMTPEEIAAAFAGLEEY